MSQRLTELAMAASVKQLAQQVEYRLNRDVMKDLLLDPQTGPDQLDELLTGVNQQQWREFLTLPLLAEKWFRVQLGKVPEKRNCQIVELTARLDLVVDVEDLYSRMFRAGLEGKRYYQYLDNRATPLHQVYKPIDIGRVTVIPFYSPWHPISMADIGLAIEQLNRQQAIRLIQDEQGQQLLAMQSDLTEWLVDSASCGMTEVFRLLLNHHYPEESSEAILSAIYPRLADGILDGLVRGRYNENNMELFQLIDQRITDQQREHWRLFKGYLAAYQGLPEMIPDRMESLGNVEEMVNNLIANGNIAALERFLDVLGIVLGSTGLLIAIDHEYTDMVALMLSRMQPQLPGNLLTMAASTGSYGIVKLLLDASGTTEVTDPLIAALHRGWKDVARLLLNRPTVLQPRAN